MTRAALTLHLIAVVLTVGPVTVAASLFPATLRSGSRRAALVGAASSGGADGADPGPVPALLHRICRVYGVLGLAVPAFGIVTAARLGVLDEGWVLTSMALTAAAGLLLALVVVPGQRQALAGPAGTGGGLAGTAAGDAVASRLAGATGAFSLLWVAVLTLMVFRPGSTLGA